MSPPEVWGPPVWTLFHTLIEQLNDNAYPHLINSMFGMITRICQFLPCPECSKDATNFLAKIKLKDYKTKIEFKQMLYLFHNWVNAKKRKPLYNYINMNKYSNLNLKYVVQNFIVNYNTKGNMKLLAESFQRKLIVKDFLNWLKYNIIAFVKPKIQEITTQMNNNNNEKSNSNEEPIDEKPIDEVIESVNEEPIDEKPIDEVIESVNEEPIDEKPINENPDEVTNKNETLE
jgi:hypothetical protein